MFLVWRAMQKEPQRNLWHSAKAKQVSLDCWVEPEKDAEVGMNYGCVKPKPTELRLLEKSQKPRQDLRPLGLKRIQAMEEAHQRELDEAEGRPPSKDTHAIEEESIEPVVAKNRESWPQALTDDYDGDGIVKLQLDVPQPTLALPGSVPALPTGATTPTSTAASTLEYTAGIQGSTPTEQKPMRQPPAAARNKRNGVAPVPVLNPMTLQQLDTGYEPRIPDLASGQEYGRTNILALQDSLKAFEKPSIIPEKPHMLALGDAPETANVAALGDAPEIAIVATS